MPRDGIAVRRTASAVHRVDAYLFIDQFCISYNGEYFGTATL